MDEKWIRDTGLLVVLIFIFFVYKGFGIALYAAALVVLILLVSPKLLAPLAWLWKKVAEGLGYVMQRVFFGIVFYIVVTPIGILRRLVAGDTRDQKRDTSRTSAFVPGTGRVTRESLARPY